MSITGSKSLFHTDSVATSVGVVAVASAASRLIGFARGVALAWLIPQAQFGLFGVALLVVNVLLPLCSAGLYEGVARYTPRHDAEGTLRRFVVRSTAIVIVMALAATSILWALARPVGSALFSAARLVSESDADAGLVDSGVAIMRASLVCVLALAAYHTLLGFLKGLRMFRALAAAELASAVAFTCLALGFAWYGHTSARALIITYAVACAAVVLVFAPGLLRRTTNTPRPESLEPGRPASSLLSFSVWAAGTALLWHVLSYYPMWYLLKVSDGETVALFHAVRLVTQFVQVAAVVLTAVIAANVNRVWEREGRQAAKPRIELLTKACLVVLIAGATIVSVVRPFVMHLFPSRFAEGATAYDPLVLFFWLVGAVGLLAIRLNVLERPRWVCCAWLVGALVNVAAAFALLGPAGEASSISDRVLPATAWAGVIGVSTALALCAWFVNREGLGVGRPTLLLLAAGFSVGFGWVVALPVLGLILVLTFATGVVFTASERASLRAGLFSARGR